MEQFPIGTDGKGFERHSDSVSNDLPRASIRNFGANVLNCLHEHRNSRLDLRHLQAAKLGLDFIEGRFGYSVLVADIGCSQAALLLFQYSDDLFISSVNRMLLAGRLLSNGHYQNLAESQGLRSQEFVYENIVATVLCKSPHGATWSLPFSQRFACPVERFDQVIKDCLATSMNIHRRNHSWNDGKAFSMLV